MSALFSDGHSWSSARGWSLSLWVRTPLADKALIGRNLARTVHAHIHNLPVFLRRTSEAER